MTSSGHIYRAQTPSSLSLAPGLSSLEGYPAADSLTSGQRPVSTACLAQGRYTELSFLKAAMRGTA